MNSPGRSNGERSGATALPRDSIGRAARCGLMLGAAGSALLYGPGLAFAGPCSGEIAALEQQIKQLPPGPKSEPSYSQTLGAQLHYQPTPRDVAHAQSVARQNADAALESAKKADAEGNDEACHAALKKARLLYGL